MTAYPRAPGIGSLPSPSQKRQFTISANAAYASSGIVSHTYDAAGYLVRRNFADGRVRTFHWDVQGRLLRVHERNAAGTGWDWEQVCDPTGRRLQTRYIPVANDVPDAAKAKRMKTTFQNIVTIQFVQFRPRSPAHKKTADPGEGIGGERFYTGRTA